MNFNRAISYKPVSDEGALELQKKQTNSLRGFALVMAMLLVSFLLLLAVSFTSLVVDETNVTKESVNRHLARQNAMFGVQIALGELQANLGPDQRVSARAEILDSSPSSPSIDGVNHPHWVGVWKTQNPADPDSELESGLRNWSYNTEGPKWLVSQSQDTVPDPRNINATSWMMLASNIRSGDSSTGSIYVPKVSVNDGASAFAWVVFDEGMKADVSQENPYKDISADDALDNQLNFLTSTKYAPVLNSEIGSVFGSISSGLEKVSSLQDVGFLAETGQTYEEVSDSLIQHSGDFTTGSYGIIANVSKGGLRKDLSRGLDDQFLETLSAQTSFSDNLIYEDSANGVYGPNWDVLAAHYKMYRENNPAVANYSSGGFIDYVDTGNLGPNGISDPRDWLPSVAPRFASAVNGVRLTSKILTNHHETGYFRKDPDTRNSETITAIQNQIFPIIVNARIDLGLESYSFTDSDSNPKVGLKLKLYPVLTLWNPYNVTLSERDYLLRWKTWTNTSGKIAFHDAISGALLEEIFVKFGESFGSGQGIVKMKTVPVSFAPGKVRVFTPDALSASLDLGASLWEDLELVSSANTSSDVSYSVDLVNNQSIVATYINNAKSDWNGISDPSGSVEVKFSYRIASQPNNLEERLRTTQFSLAAPRINGLPRSSSTGSEPIGYIAKNINVEMPDPRELDLGLLSNLNERVSGAILRIASVDNSVAPVFSQMNLRRSQDVTSEFELPAIYESVYDLSNGSSSELEVESLDGIGFWGNASSSGGESHVVLFDVPRLPLLSVGSLMHADGGYDDWAPNYVIGGSLASPYIPRDKRVADPFYVDLSHYANEAIFDQYFFSSVPSSDRAQNNTAPFNEEFDQGYLEAGLPLPNPSMIAVSPSGNVPAISELRDFDTAAENLLIKGAFNVNSTSVAAWEAFLGGLRGQEMKVYSMQTDSELTLGEAEMQNPFSRFSSPLGRANDDWNGFRVLSDDEIRELAEAIVEQVKLRGPFLSLSDFVNRRLSNDILGYSGALQAAIDSTTINAGLDNNPLDSSPFPHQENLVSGNGVGQPTWLMQQDILVSHAPKISARSDTFIIRSYGEVAGSSDDAPAATAWCEVKVQRVASFVDEIANDPSDEVSELSAVNAQFGRGFKVVDFRWIDNPN
ncbi:MAG: hypothetical protein ACPGN3_08685 [Opitutales bacterium]